MVTNGWLSLAKAAILVHGFEAPVRAQTITTYDVGENHLYSSNSALNPSISFLTSKLFTFGHFCNLVNVSVEGVLRRLASSHFLS